MLKAGILPNNFVSSWDKKQYFGGRKSTKFLKWQKTTRSQKVFSKEFLFLEGKFLSNTVWFLKKIASNIQNYNLESQFF